MKKKNNFWNYLVWFVFGFLLGFLVYKYYISVPKAGATSELTTICHCTPEGCDTIGVAEEALAGHFDAQGNPLHEGDHLGACDADPTATPTPTPSVPYVHIDRDCEGGITFYNPTDWLFVFDVRVDDEAYLDDGTGDAWYGIEIHEGDLKGQTFGARWREVVVDGRQDQHQAFLSWSDLFSEDTGTHKVEYRLAEGAEQNMYFDWQTVRELDSNCKPDITPTPEPTQPPQDHSGSVGAPQCPNGRPATPPANAHVIRNGSSAVVNAHIPEGDKVNIYFKENGETSWKHAVADIQVTGKYVSYTIHDLNPALGYTFGIQAGNGCAGGEVVLAVIIDPPAFGVVFPFSYWEWLK